MTLGRIKEIIGKSLREQHFAIMFSIIFAIVSLLWAYFSGKPFDWRTIEPLSVPDWERALYSYLAYVTFGAFLYWAMLYKLLSFVFVELFRDYKAFVKIKRAIWVFLMILMYQRVVPWIVNTLNAIISFLYNILALVLYLIPPLGIALIVAIALPMVIHFVKTSAPPQKDLNLNLSGRLDRKNKM